MESIVEISRRATFIALLVALCLFLPVAALADWVTETVAPFEYTLVANYPDKWIAVEKTTNHPHMVYGDMELRHAYFTGTQWQHEVVDNASGVGLSASIAIDSANKLHVSYYDAGNNTIKYATNASGSWVTSVTDTNSNVFTSIAVDANDKVHIAYTTLTGYLKYATNASGSWTKINFVSDYNGYYNFLAEDPSLAIDSSNKVHIAFVFTHYNGDAVTGLGYIGNISSNPQLPWHLEPLYQRGWVGTRPSLALDAANKAHLAYTTAGPSACYIESYDLYNNPWFWGSSQCWPGYAAVVAEDTGNKSHFSYFQYPANAVLKYATNASGQWVVTSLTSTSADYTSIAVDANSKAHIGFYDPYTNAFKYATNACPTWYHDADNDGYGDPSDPRPACTPPAGYVLNNTDCNDSNANINPASVWYKDADNDGYSDGATISSQCARPTGYKLASELIATSGDCNDSNPAINPATVWYRDMDNDGYSNGATIIQCARPAGYKLSSELIAISGDCNDNDATVNPGAMEGPLGSPTCSDGKDNNCDGRIDNADPLCLLCIDNDHDGYAINGGACGPVDCNDNDPTVNPGMREILGNGKDDDCNVATSDGIYLIKTIDDAPVLSNFNQRAIAIDKITGRPHMVIGGDHLYHMYFDGSAWITETVDSSPRVGQSASLAIDQYNKVHISYYDEYNSALRYATNASGSWVISIVDNSGNVGQSTSLALDSNNKIHIVYYDNTSPNYSVKYATDASGTWVTAAIGSTGGSTVTSLAIDSYDKAHVSYYDRTNGDLKYATNASGQWVLATIDSTGQVGYYISIAVEPSGRAHIGYYDVTNGDLKYATNSGVVSGNGNCSGNTNWICSTLDSSGDVGYYPSIAIDPNGKVHISHSGRIPGYSLKLVTNVSGTWSTSTIDAGAVELSTSLTLDANNKAHIGYYDWYYQAVKYATNASGSWSISSIGSTGNVGQYTSLVRDANNKTHISYYDAVNGDLKYATNTSGQWIVSTIDSAGNVGQYTSLAKDFSNKMHISYYDASNGDLKYATNASGQWVISTIDSPGNVGQYSSLAVDANTKVHISYYDATNFDLKYVTNASGQWIGSIIDSTGYVGEYSSLVVDSNNKVHISYYDATNTNLKYATNSSGQWAIETADGIGTVMDYKSTAIAVDSNNKPHISYCTQELDFPREFLFDIKHATNASGTWAISTIESGAYFGGQTSIAMDPNNKAHISYYFDRDLKYANDLSGTWNISLVDSSYWEAGDYNSIVVDSNNRIHVSYYDSFQRDLVYATNAQSTFSVTPSAGPGGSIIPDTVQTVVSGVTITFTIVPNLGYSIGTVTGCGGTWTGINPYTTGPITEDCTVSATFVQNQYTATASAGTGGSITPASRLVVSGATTTFLVTPITGYAATMSGTCGGSPAGGASQFTYTTNAITSNCMVSASFTLTVAKPAAPTGLNGVPGSNVVLSWTDNASNETGYQVYRRLKTDVAWTMITDIGTDSTNYTDPTAVADTTYQYRVAAYNAAGASTSSVINVTTGVLLPPDNLNAEIVSNGPSVSLLWRDNSTLEDGYQVFRRQQGDTDWVSIATLPANSTIYTDLTSSTRVLYRYQVCATTNAGGSACSVVDGVNGPSSLIATQGSGSTYLTWTDNSDDEAVFRVHRREATEATWSMIGSVGANTTSFTDSTAAQDMTYDYYVSAHNSAAASRSHRVRFTTGNLAPPTLSSVASLGTQADLAWNDNAGTEDGYTVWKRSAASPQWTAVNALPADSTHATDTGLTAGVLYAYQVCATTAAGGNACSGIKAVNNPTGFTVSYNAGTGAILNWLDNASDEAGYRVFRKAAGETVFTVIRILDRDSASFMDPSVVSGTTYQYRVCAFNAVASSCTPVGQLLVP